MASSTVRNTASTSTAARAARDQAELLTCATAPDRHRDSRRYDPSIAAGLENVTTALRAELKELRADMYTPIDMPAGSVPVSPA